MTATPRDIPAVLDRGLAERPDAVAVEARSGTLTYRQLDTAATHAAGGLWESGLRPADRLAVCLPNDLAVVVAFHAAMRIGLIWVGIGSALALPEKVRLLAHSTPRTMLTSPDLASDLESDAGWGPRSPHLIRVALMPDVAGRAAPEPDVAGQAAPPEKRTEEWADLVAAALPQPSVDIDPHAPAGIAYTSGTVGSPKGIVHSQHNLLMPGAVLVSERKYGPDLRKGDCLPLTILNLMALTTLLTAQAGGCCVVMDRRDPVGIAEWLRNSRIGVWNGVPTQLRDLVSRADISRSDLATLREVWCGGGDCPDELRDAFAGKFGHQIRATYGLTEVPTIVAMDPVAEQWSTGSSGTVLPQLSVEILDDRGDRLTPGEVGEICISAAPSGTWANQWTPMLGSWEGTGVVPAPAGPLRTGDLGTLDEAGWLRVVDRRKLLIVRGGANVYPAEVERVLAEVPEVAGAAVFGVPDDRLGERVAALIETGQPVGTDPQHPCAADLADYCAKHLARYKVPDLWGFVETLPRNAMGKVVRTDLPRLLSMARQPEAGAGV
jgi:long-chain acyl-CoA synthetase